MKKKLLFTAFLAISFSAVTFAQVSTTPEVPRNYKPQPKELLPMPDSLTDEQIFPVLGMYDLADKTGTTAHVTISRDAENKGTVWVSGLPQGKFKADLKASPATYKIPAQKTVANDEGMAATEDVSSETATGKTKSKVVTGRSIQEGTMVFDKDANTLYVNVGSKFKEEDPTYVFPEMMVAADATQTVEVDATDETAKPKKTTTKKPVIKGVTYTGLKTTTETEMTAPATPADSTSQN